MGVAQGNPSMHPPPHVRTKRGGAKGLLPLALIKLVHPCDEMSQGFGGSR